MYLFRGRSNGNEGERVFEGKGCLLLKTLLSWRCRGTVRVFITPLPALVLTSSERKFSDSSEATR